jgi:flagellar basal body-associated protein FliL
MPDVQLSPAPIDAIQSVPEPSPRKSKRWPAVAIAVVLGATGILVWWGTQRTAGATAGVAESTVTLETFVVNLTGSSQRAYLRVGITLGLAHPLARGQADAVPTALVRDTILSVLATAQPEALLQIEGKRQLKEELLKALQERVPQLAVEHVYFTEFLVQM